MGLLTSRELGVSISDIRICRNLALEVAPGSRWAILGRNGVGKSTLLKTLAGLHAADHGGISIDGAPLGEQPLRRLAQRIGVLFQDQVSLFPGTVLETALIGRHPWLDRLSQEGPDDIGIATAALEAVGLAGFERRSLSTLSGGELQRLSIATLLTQDPALYLLDEPSNHLDPHHQIHIMELLCRRIAAADDRALIMVLHDVNLAVRFCDHALLLFGNGEATQGESRDILTAHNLERLYGHPMQAVETVHGTYFYPQ